MKQSTQEKRIESLDRAKSGESLMNYPAIITGFLEMGIPVDDIRPRENIFTFNAWKALGRSVKKGEHGIKVVTFIETADKADKETGETIARGFRRPWTTTVFHVSQTEVR